MVLYHYSKKVVAGATSMIKGMENYILKSYQHSEFLHTKVSEQMQITVGVVEN